VYRDVIGGKLNRLRRRKPCIRPPHPIDEENEKDEAGDLVGDDRNACFRSRFLGILTDFRVRYAALIDQYNESATAALAQGTAPDTKLFLQKRNDLVQSVMATLRQSLSTEGMKKLDSYIQSQKRAMKVDAAEAQ
jgi:hypothetical protein